MTIPHSGRMPILLWTHRGCWKRLFRNLKHCNVRWDVRKLTGVAKQLSTYLNCPSYSSLLLCCVWDLNHFMQILRDPYHTEMLNSCLTFISMQPDQCYLNLIWVKCIHETYCQQRSFWWTASLRCSASGQSQISCIAVHCGWWMSGRHTAAEHHAVLPHWKWLTSVIRDQFNSCYIHTTNVNMWAETFTEMSEFYTREEYDKIYNVLWNTAQFVL